MTRERKMSIRDKGFRDSSSSAPQSGTTAGEYSGHTSNHNIHWSSWVCTSKHIIRDQYFRYNSPDAVTRAALENTLVMLLIV